MNAIPLEAVNAAAKMLHAANCPGDCGMLPGGTGMPVTACCEEPADEEYDATWDMLAAAYPHIRAQVYAEIRQLATEVDATYEERGPCSCGAVHCRGVLLNSQAPFADLIPGGDSGG